MNPYLLLIGAFALWYIPGALALYKVEYSLKGFQLLAIKETYFDVQLNLIVKNVTGTVLKVKSLDVSVYVDGTYVSELITKDLVLQPNSSQTVAALLRLNKKDIPTVIWNSFINNNFQNSIFTFKGIARANGRPYPFVCEMTVKEILEYYG